LIADFGAALAVTTAIKKAPECCGFMQFERTDPCRSSAPELLPSGLISLEIDRAAIYSQFSFVPG
jgi:hypothetical protein